MEGGRRLQRTALPALRDPRRRCSQLSQRWVARFIPARGPPRRAGLLWSCGAPGSTARCARGRRRARQPTDRERGRASADFRAVSCRVVPPALGAQRPLQALEQTALGEVLELPERFVSHHGLESTPRYFEPLCAPPMQDRRSRCHRRRPARQRTCRGAFRRRARPRVRSGRLLRDERAKVVSSKIDHVARFSSGAMTAVAIVERRIRAARMHLDLAQRSRSRTTLARASVSAQRGCISTSHDAHRGRGDPRQCERTPPCSLTQGCIPSLSSSLPRFSVNAVRCRSGHPKRDTSASGNPRRAPAIRPGSQPTCRNHHTDHFGRRTCR